jgi:rRNA maturation endonuclease Nob1
MNKLSTEQMLAEIKRLRQDVDDARETGYVSRCRACNRLGLRPGLICLLCGHDPTYNPSSRDTKQG